DLNPDKVGKIDNYVTFASDYGTQIEHWNGVDITVNARPRDGVLLQGGVSTGRTSFDNCDIRAKLPEYMAVTPFQASALLSTNVFCHVDEQFQTQVKLLGTYMIPRADVRVAATFQSVPGFPIIANYNAPTASIKPSLG